MKYRIYFLPTVILILLILILVRKGHAHDIDNLSHHMNAMPGEWIGSSFELRNRFDSEKPHHCDGGVCEGMKTNSCLTNQTVIRGRTTHDRVKNFWHLRRNLVDQIVILAGNVNALNERKWAQGDYSRTQFMHYDPFGTVEANDNDVQHYYESTLVPSGYLSSIQPRGLNAIYSYFWIPAYIDLPAQEGLTGSTSPYKLKRCDELTDMEKFHVFQCDFIPAASKVLAGGNSYKAPFPYRGESFFNYYSRIPASPTDSACIEYLEGRWSIEEVNDYIEAHEHAGYAHLLETISRVRYSELLLNKYRQK